MTMVLLMTSLSCLGGVPKYYGDMVVDGIAYLIISQEDRTVETTYKIPVEVGGDHYSGDVVIPETIEHEGVTYTVVAIGVSTFDGSYLSSVKIPSTVTEIKNRAFAFLLSYSPKIIIPNTVRRFGDNIFEGGVCPQRVVFPEEVDSLGREMFYGHDLSHHTEPVVLPKNITIIPQGFFYNSLLQQWIDLPEGVKVIDTAAFRGNEFSSVRLPEQLQEIRENAFCACLNLKSVTIPASVTYIGPGSFSDIASGPLGHFGTCYLDTLRMLSEVPCKNEMVEEIKSTVIIVPNGTKELYRQAWNLAETPIYEESELGINNEETGVQDDINYDYRRWAGSLENDTIVVDGLSYFFNIDSTAVHPSLSNIGRPRRVIPESVEYGGKVYPVYLVHQIFEGDTILEDIELRCKMRELVSFFNGCTHLEKVELPNSITQIGPHAFDDTKIKSIVLPKSLKRLLSGAFYGCADLETIVVNDSIEEVGLSAINRCPKLKSFRFPASVKNILNPFYLVDSLKTIIFDDGDGPLSTTNIADLYSTVYRIDYLYCGRRSMNPDWEFPILKQLVIGEPVRILELKNINIEDAGSLKVYARSTSPQDIYLDFGDSSEDIYSKSTLIVPEGTREMYISTGGWRNFAKIVEGDVEEVVSTGVQDVRQSTHSKSIYNLAGQKVDASYKGIVIQNGKKRILR